MKSEMEQRVFDSMKSILAPKAAMVSICGWCPDARERTKQLIEEGKVVSHGMCPVCVRKMESQIAAAEQK